MEYSAFSGPLEELRSCVICPRQCGADRFGSKLGVCRSDASFNIASVCIHRGEEPAISGRNGICNIFFAHCNLQCLYCQNHQISNNRTPAGRYRMEIGEIISRITALLDKGITHVGFVSPSHYVPQVKMIISIVEAMGYKPVWVYNTNGYDRVETLKNLEGIIDVYLPDFKYMDSRLAKELSGVPDYPFHAAAALKEMYRQKGAALHLSEQDTAESGIIVRHLVLPGETENSLDVIRFLAEEISPRIHLSLMSQYYPTPGVKNFRSFGRGITGEEYDMVKDEMEKFGMTNGWIQEFESSEFYRPDFDRDHPFEI